MTVVEELHGLFPAVAPSPPPPPLNDTVGMMGDNSSASPYSPRDNHLVEFYLFPVIILIGTVCNILTFIVMRRKKMRHQSTYFYMAVLAIADEMVLIVGCLNFWVYLYTGKNVVLLSNVACKIVCLLLYATFHFSVWTVVIMTIERFIAVAMPLQASHLCTVKRAKMATVTMALLILLVNVHFLFTHALIERHNETGCQAKTDGYEMFMFKIWPWIDASLYSFIPLSLLIIFNVLIIINLLKASKNLKKLNGNTSSQAGARRPTTNANEQNSIYSSTKRNSDCLLKDYPLNSNNGNSSINLNSHRQSKGVLIGFMYTLACCFRTRKSLAHDNSERANTNKRVYKFKHINTGGESSTARDAIECRPLTNQIPSIYHQQPPQQQQPSAGNPQPPAVSTQIKTSPTSNLTVGGRRNNNTEPANCSQQNIYSSTTYLSTQQQQQQAQSSAASRRLTIMLLLVSLTFFVTSTPIVTLQTVEQAKLVAPSHYLYILRGVFLILQYLNHSANFFLYAVTGKTFRKEFFALFNPCRSKTTAARNAANAKKSTTNMASSGMVHSRSGLPLSNNNSASRMMASKSSMLIAESGKSGDVSRASISAANASTRNLYNYKASVSRTCSTPGEGTVRVVINDMG